MTNQKRIETYGIDIDYISKVSAFELVNTLAIRDAIEEDYYSLTADEQTLLFEYDRKLLEKAELFYNELSQFYSFNGLRPINYWWTHIDKVVTGELIVDLYKREVRLKNNDEHAATLTA